MKAPGVTCGVSYGVLDIPVSQIVLYEQQPVSTYYGSTISGTLSFQLVLKVKNKPEAGFAAVPSLTAFKVLALSGGGSGTGIYNLSSG